MKLPNGIRVVRRRRAVMRVLVVGVVPHRTGTKRCRRWRRGLNISAGSAYQRAMDRPVGLRALVLAALAVPSAALAHGDEIHEGEGFWSLWHWSPEIIMALLLAAFVYGRGVARGARVPIWRMIAFAGGLLALFLALISPIEPLADHIFAVHQVEHMLLRTMAPMLIFLSAPQGVLMRGLPRRLRRGLAGPVITSGFVRRPLGFLTHPAVATLLFVGVSWFWMYPPWHDLAIVNEPIHYGWHVSLLVTGLLFFSVLFDPRAAPAGPGLATRLVMFVVAALGNILLGAFLAFKSVPLYSAYAILGHFWHVSMLTDEQTGGIIMWIPGCMMFAICAILIVYRWGEDEGRVVARRARDGRDLRGVGRRGNAALALGLGAFAALMVMLAVGIVAFVDGSRRLAAPLPRHPAIVVRGDV